MTDQVLRSPQSMSDQNFHEIQLSGKQLFFFFMCAVVVAAVIFLLGVSVGRDFRTAPIQTAQVASEPEPAPPPAAPPPATETAPNELSYAQALQGGTSDPAKVAPPAPPPEPPSSPPARREGAAASAQTAAPASPPAPVTKTDSRAAETPKAVAKAEPPKSEPARSDASKSQATKAAKSESSAPPVDATGEFSLQMGAFNTEAAATSMIANLKRRGYSASLVTLPEKTEVRFRVYVGPYRTRVDAQRAQSRLEKEGFKSLIRR
jgi:cell division protein FtsN